MNKILGWAIVVLVIAGAGIFLRLRTRTPEPQAPLPAAPQIAAPAPAPELPVHYPLPKEADTGTKPQPLPSVQESDHALTEALTHLLGRKAVVEFFYPQKIVRHIVATIDNLPRHTLSTQVLPVKPLESKFLTSSDGQNLMIAPENYARYTPYVHAMEMTDTKKLVAVYVHFYPLFQQAYHDLGYPDGDFNDRLVAVIDHLLATPDISGPVHLVQPKVLYQYADAELENASAGRKILFRMGPENAAKVKAKLRAIRKELTGADLK